jgi:hypothetical protein
VGAAPGSVGDGDADPDGAPGTVAEAAEAAEVGGEIVLGSLEPQAASRIPAAAAASPFSTNLEDLT